MAVRKNAAWGAVWENIVIAEFRKAAANCGGTLPLYYWRTASGREVDLLIETGHRQVVAVEVKATEMPGRDDLKGLESFAHHYGAESLQKALLVCRTPNPYPVVGQTIEADALPVSKAVEELVEK